MVPFDRWVFPDGETHLPSKMAKKGIRVEGRLTYQYPLYTEGLRRCRNRRVAVDVGAHVGLFSYWMIRDFAQLVAVEPVEAHRACWTQNVPARPGDVLHPCALGARPGTVALSCDTPASSGGTFISGPGDIPLCTLDSFALPVVDLLKIDCEGYECEVVEGAQETLARCHPVCIVEQRPRQVARMRHGAVDAIRVLTRAGGRVLWTDRRDYVVGWV